MLATYFEEVQGLHRLDERPIINQLFSVAEGYELATDVFSMTLADVCMTRADLEWLAEWGITVEGDERE